LSSVSVIIPSCDRPGRLRRALASVLAQRSRPVEILVVDDGSVPLDGHELPAGARILRDAGLQGACHARNLGAAQARGRWLAFLDDDDRWHPAYLEEAQELARRGQADVVLTAFTKVRELPQGSELVPEKVPPSALRAEHFFVRNPGLRGSNLFIRRQLYLAVGGFDEGLPSHNDLDLGVRLADHPGVGYRRNRQRRVFFHVHSGPRLSAPGSPANVAGIRAFYERYAERMGAELASDFRARSLQLFGVDPVSEPRGRS